jgi:Fur family ferric uptake transcriptional regulator
VDVQRTAELSRQLRERGLRATGPRVEVLAALEDLGGHRTADEVRDQLAAAGQPLPRSSVYNVLTSLAEAGLAMTADAGPGAVLYEAGQQWHHHFVCRSCHRIFDVKCVIGARPCLTPGTDVGIADEAQVIFRGTCTDCATGAQ